MNHLHSSGPNSPVHAGQSITMANNNNNNKPSSPERGQSNSARSSRTNSPEVPVQPSQRASLNGDRLCLNPFKVNNRRHSSEMKNILPKISISRAKSDIDLMLNSVHPKRVHYPADLFVGNEATLQADKTLVNYGKLGPNVQLKEHNYQSVTKVLNLKSNKCRICSESIFFHCYECVQCKLVAHKKCLQNLYVKCPNKSMPPRLTVFGLNISDDDEVSEILGACISEIEKRPVNKLKSIYKTEGNQSVIDNLCLSFEFGPHLIDLCKINVHDIAGVVKEYLSKLSSPIFSKEVQDELIAIGKEWPVRKVPYTQSGLAILIFELRRLVSYLSPSHKNNLAYLIFHMKRIVDRQNLTEMTANSLGIVFANIIFKVQREKEEAKSDGGGGKSSNRHHQNGKSFSTNGANEESASRVTMDNRIVLDAKFKIRVLELMILHASDIFL